MIAPVVAALTPPGSVRQGRALDPQRDAGPITSKELQKLCFAPALLGAPLPVWLRYAPWPAHRHVRRSFSSSPYVALA